MSLIVELHCGGVREQEYIAYMRSASSGGSWKYKGVTGLPHLMREVGMSEAMNPHTTA